jgi:hypothetical protein
MFDWLNPYASPSIPADGFCHPQFALDEVAAALHVVRGRPSSRRIVNSVKLALQFASDFGAKDWRRLERELDVVLPPLEARKAVLDFPSKWETVFDVADYLAAKRLEFEPPPERTLAAWRNAQIFAGVRDALEDATGLRPQMIHREASFVKDLGFE